MGFYAVPLQMPPSNQIGEILKWEGKSGLVELVHQLMTGIVRSNDEYSLQLLLSADAKSLSAELRFAAEQSFGTGAAEVIHNLSMLDFNESTPDGSQYKFHKLGGYELAVNLKGFSLARDRKVQHTDETLEAFRLRSSHLFDLLGTQTDGIPESHSRLIVPVDLYTLQQCLNGLVQTRITQPKKIAEQQVQTRVTGFLRVYPGDKPVVEYAIDGDYTQSIVTPALNTLFPKHNETEWVGNLGEAGERYMKIGVTPQRLYVRVQAKSDEPAEISKSLRRMYNSVFHLTVNKINTNHQVS